MSLLSVNKERAFNLSQVIEVFGLKVEDLARALYPTVKYPQQALSRVLKGEAELDALQIELLAQYAGVLVTDLYNVGASWKRSSEDGHFTFKKGEYKAVLSYKNVFVSVYKNGDLIFQEIANIPSMKIPEFINFLDNIIKKYEDGNN